VPVVVSPEILALGCDWVMRYMTVININLLIDCIDCK
jgi:hypothetical protein